MSLPARAPLLPAVLVMGFALGGCSLLGSMRPVNPDVTSPDTTAAPAATEARPADAQPPDGGGASRKAPKTPPVAARPPKAAAPDSAVVIAPDHAPTVTIRLSAEERTERETQYRENVDRAVRSLALVRGRAIGKTDREELAAADQFLTDARRAFDAADLTRACTVAEKARVLAEELRARLAPP